MKTACRVALSACSMWICLTGCGGKSTPPTPPGGGACAGAVISGILHDSLTGKPVAQGTAVLESGTELSVTSLYEFFPAQTAATDARGGFSLCAQTVTHPSAVVLEAMDSAGNAYPPFVASVSGAADLGTIPMGGCTLICGFEGEQQTAAPATITGVITSSPVAMAGTVVPEYAMEALDGSKSPDGTPNLWAIAVPSLNASQTLTFSTAAGACAAGAPFCSSYTFALPSQSPVWHVSGGYLEPSAPPTYLIYAAGDSAPSCIPSAISTIFQQDGKSLLTADPGAQLSVANIDFTGCH